MKDFRGVLGREGFHEYFSKLFMKGAEFYRPLPIDGKEIMMKIANAAALGVVLALGAYSTGAWAGNGSMTVADSSDVVKEKAPLPGNRVEGGPNPRFDRQSGEASDVVKEKDPLPGNRVEGGPNPRFDRQSGEASDVIEEKAPLPGNRVEGGPNPRFDRKPE